MQIHIYTANAGQLIFVCLRASRTALFTFSLSGSQYPFRLRVNMSRNLAYC